MGRGAVEALEDLSETLHSTMSLYSIGYMGRGAVETLEDLSEALHYTYILHLLSSLQREE